MSSILKVLGQDAADFKIIATDDGDRVAIGIRVRDEHNFHKAEQKLTFLNVLLTDLEAFLAGFTITPTGIDGSCDGEVTVKILREDGEYNRLTLNSHLEALHAPYMIWTNDGVYDDPELRSLQERMAIATTLAKDVTANQRLGFSMDSFDSLFTENLPQAFLNGLIWFQELSDECHTHLILPEDDPEDEKRGNLFDPDVESDNETDDLNNASSHP